MSIERFKRIGYLFFLFTFFCFGLSEVNALETASLTSNDYELICNYRNGTELTITKDDVYIINNSLSVSSKTPVSPDFFLASDQQNIVETSTGEVTEYKQDALLHNYKCPKRLYGYTVKGKHDESLSDQEQKDLKKKDMFYYGTRSDLAVEIGGISCSWWFLWLDCGSENASRRPEIDTSLVSEQGYVITSKDVKICDYKVDTESNAGVGSTASLYLFSNINFLEISGYSTPVDGTPSACPAGPDPGGIIYINDPTPKASSGSSIAAQVSYRSDKFFYATNASECKAKNDNKDCQQFVFIGERGPECDPAVEECPVPQTSVCDVLGNKTIEIIQEIIGALQIVVPVLVIGLTGFEIGRIVIAGNLDEELPKRRKAIIIRFVVMVFFFFLPLLSNLIIQLLYDAGFIEIGNIACLFE